MTRDTPDAVPAQHPNTRSESVQLPLWAGAPTGGPPVAARQERLPPHQPSSPTSREAAASVAELAPGMRGRVYGHIVAQRHHGATREEVALALDMRMATVSARANELLRLGLVRERGTRPTTSGRAAAVLVAAGRQEAP